MKHKLLHIIITIIFILLIILVVLAISRFFILSKIQENNEFYESQNNCHYYLEGNNAITEYWRKDSIMKLNIKYLDNNSDMIFWKNLDTNEDLIFYNSNEKIYSNSNGGMIERLPIGITFTENIGTRILMAINPTLYIGSKEYNGINCYYIKQFDYEEFIDKETGLILYSNYDNDIRKIYYTFDEVTDEDVKKPNIQEYTYKE